MVEQLSLGASNGPMVAIESSHAASTYSDVSVSPEDVSILKGCPHFREWDVKGS